MSTAFGTSDLTHTFSQASLDSDTRCDIGLFQDSVALIFGTYCRNLTISGHKTWLDIKNAVLEVILSTLRSIESEIESGAFPESYPDELQVVKGQLKDANRFYSPDNQLYVGKFHDIKDEDAIDHTIRTILYVTKALVVYSLPIIKGEV